MTKFTGNILITGPMASGKTILARTIDFGIRVSNAQQPAIIDVYNGYFVPAIPRRETILIITAETMDAFKQANAGRKQPVAISRHIELKKLN